MPVRVRCPECEATVKAPEAARGKAVRCDECGAKVRVPGGKKRTRAGRSSKKSRSDADAPDEADVPVDDDLFAKMDLSRVEDRHTQVCPNCGTKVLEDNEDGLCHKCGVDLDTGKLRKKERLKKERGGPDVDKFYGRVWSEPIRFMKLNLSLPLRTCLYSTLSVMLACTCYWMLRWCANEPPKWFWGLCMMIAAMVPIGWTWHLTQKIIQATMAKKKELEKVRYDFFLNAYLGIEACNWLLAISMGLAFAGLICVLVRVFIVGYILIGVAFFFALPLVPISMTHLSMPQTYRGWLAPIVVKIFFKVPKACLTWTLVFLASMMPVFIGIGLIVGVWGNEIRSYFSTLSFNSKMKIYWPDQEIFPIDHEVLIGPGIVLFCVVVYYGIVSVYWMRAMGLFSYYFGRDLELITLTKETTWDPDRVKRNEYGEVIVKKNPLAPYAGLIGTIVFYLVANIVLYFLTGGKVWLLPKFGKVSL